MASIRAAPPPPRNNPQPEFDTHHPTGNVWQQASSALALRPPPKATTFRAVSRHRRLWIHRPSGDDFIGDVLGYAGYAHQHRLGRLIDIYPSDNLLLGINGVLSNSNGR